AVLHLAAGAVEVLVEGAGVGTLGFERGHDKARIGLALGPLGLADDPPAAAPAVERRPQEVLEAPGRRAARAALGGGFGKLAFDLRDQPWVARQAKQVVDAVVLAPGHQAITG